MSIEIIKRIVDWAELKEPWCQDAIRRIYQQGHLEKNDVDAVNRVVFYNPRYSRTRRSKYDDTLMN